MGIKTGEQYLSGLRDGRDDGGGRVLNAVERRCEGSLDEDFPYYPWPETVPGPRRHDNR